MRLWCIRPFPNPKHVCDSIPIAYRHIYSRFYSYVTKLSRKSRKVCSIENQQNAFFVVVVVVVFALKDKRSIGFIITLKMGQSITHGRDRGYTLASSQIQSSENIQTVHGVCCTTAAPLPPILHDLSIAMGRRTDSHHGKKWCY